MAGDVLAADQAQHPDVPVRAQPADHRAAGGDHADRGDLRLLRGPLADGEQPPDRGARRRCRHDRAQLRRRSLSRQPRRAGGPGAEDPRSVGHAPAGGETARRPSRLPVPRRRPLAAQGPGGPHRRAVLVRYRALSGLCRRPGDDAARGAPLHRAEGPGVRHPGPHLPALADGRHPAPHRHRHRLHPQPGAGDRAAGRGGGGLRQGRRRQLPSPWRARGAPGRPRLSGDEEPDRTARRPAREPARRGQPRPAHAPDPAETGAGAVQSRASGPRR